jgi:hypothetical protein
MTQREHLRAKGCPQHFAIFLTLGAGVTPAEGGVEPTAGSTFDKVRYALRAWLSVRRAAIAAFKSNRIASAYSAAASTGLAPSFF